MDLLRFCTACLGLARCALSTVCVCLRRSRSSLLPEENGWCLALGNHFPPHNARPQSLHCPSVPVANSHRQLNSSERRKPHNRQDGQGQPKDSATAQDPAQEGSISHQRCRRTRVHNSPSQAGMPNLLCTLNPACLRLNRAQLPHKEPVPPSREWGTETPKKEQDHNQFYEVHPNGWQDLILETKSHNIFYPTMSHKCSI